MIALLDAGERETVFTVCGVLINLMSDEELKPKLKDEDGIKKWVLSCNEKKFILRTRMRITHMEVKIKFRLTQLASDWNQESMKIVMKI